MWGPPLTITSVCKSVTLGTLWHKPCHRIASLLYKRQVCIFLKISRLTTATILFFLQIKGRSLICYSSKHVGYFTSDSYRCLTSSQLPQASIKGCKLTNWSQKCLMWQQFMNLRLQFLVTEFLSSKHDKDFLFSNNLLLLVLLTGGRCVRNSGLVAPKAT